MSAVLPQAPRSKPFCQSVLRVPVPFVVALARKRMPIGQVVNLVPGMIIQFDKPCTSPMQVEVEGQPIAEGEIVKIGDKFGIRIGEILPVAERFVSVTPRAE